MLIERSMQRMEARTVQAQALQLCYEIEKLAASEQQTKVSLAASALHSALEKLCSFCHG